MGIHSVPVLRYLPGISFFISVSHITRAYQKTSMNSECLDLAQGVWSLLKDPKISTLPQFNKIFLSGSNLPKKSNLLGGIILNMVIRQLSKFQAGRCSHFVICVLVEAILC